MTEESCSNCICLEVCRLNFAAITACDEGALDQEDLAHLCRAYYPAPSKGTKDEKSKRSDRFNRDDLAASA